MPKKPLGPPTIACVFGFPEKENKERLVTRYLVG